MCGIAGFVGFGRLDGRDVESVAGRMGEAIAHRGPDDSGVWFDAGPEVALVFRRLSIIDLSAAGHQPMLSPSGRYVAIFNGEIYNHLDLRASLGSNAPAWRGHSDTESLLAGFDAWGIRKTIVRAIGMFATAVWDRQRRVLTLVRDRAGEKPLYYGRHNGVLLFGSELKALRAHPAFTGEIDRQALSLQLFHNYIPAPHSIYRGIRKLPPGTFLEISADGPIADNPLEPTRYWSWPRTPGSAASIEMIDSDEVAVSRLDEILRRAVARQMVADVPLGAFLSGGIDSSTVVAMMQAQSPRPVRTFTIGFQEPGYDESAHAKAVAHHLGTDHTELLVTPEDARAVIPLLPRFFDEPFSDSSQIPTFLLARLTRQHVTVSLSGDAADELFGGYSRYFRIAKAWSLIHRIPSAVRRLSAAAIRALPVPVWNGLSVPARPFLPLRGRNIGHKAHKFAELLGQDDRMHFYKRFDCHWPFPEQVVVGASAFERPEPANPALTFQEEMMLADSLSYLPDDILAKVDRAAMANGLETRVPFLDRDVVEFAATVPLRMKIRDGQGKWVLRQVLDKYVPRELIERPKMGFGVPIDSWLRGPLREWGEALLDESRLRNEGYLHPTPIRKAWTEHMSGQRNWQYQLWDILMFQQWLEYQRGN
ncbi:MAG: asparagine synthase (glutamine-hydrolyzing) [Ramlibacter sp.]